MGLFHGKNGAVDFGASGVASIKSWSYEESVEVADKTAMGDSAKSYEPGIPDGNGSITYVMSVVNASAQDAGQAAIQVGDEVTLSLYPAGETSSYSKWSGTVVVTGISRGADLSSMGEFSFTFQGKLTQGTVT